MRNGRETLIPCHMPTKMARFLSSDKLAYVCTTNPEKKPFISPVFFAWNFGSNKCEIGFCSSRKSKFVNNLLNNPFLSLTVDEKHPSDTLGNHGIMVDGFVEFYTDSLHSSKMIDQLRNKYARYKKYKSFQRLMARFDVTIYVRITKVVHWRGPFFSRHTCPIHADLEDFGVGHWKEVLKSNIKTSI